MFRSALLLFLVLTLPVRANLGETVEQCVARYGRPIGYSEANAQSPFGTVVFAAAGYKLTVFLIGTTEVGARIVKDEGGAFTDTEQQNILAADSDGTPWNPTTSDDPTCLCWTRGDKATALYDKQKHTLLFSSTAMAAALKAHPAKPDAAN